MTLAVTLRKALEKRYGAAGYTSIRAEVDELAAIGGGRAVALDDAMEMAAVGVSPLTATDAVSVGAAIRGVRQSLNDPGSALLLIGGDDVIPFWQVANPVQDRVADSDTVVFTDNYYGATAETLEEILAPSLAVGRLADANRMSAADFTALIALARANRQARPVRSGSGAVINQEWLDFSHRAGATLPDPVDWHQAPGYVLDGGNMRDSDREALYFNLHGFSGVPEWKGYSDVRRDYIKAASPDSFSAEFVSGTIIYAENCYGTEIIGRSTGNCCALRILKEGAAIIGATGRAFGSHIAPDMFLEDADLLARFFFESFFRDRLPLGKALHQAKLSYLNDPGTPSSDPFKQKTLLQFTLLGDPEWN